MKVQVITQIYNGVLEDLWVFVDDELAMIEKFNKVADISWDDYRNDLRVEQPDKNFCQVWEPTPHGAATAYPGDKDNLSHATGGKRP